MGAVYPDDRLRRARTVVVKPPSRFSRTDWLALGLAALAEDGPLGLTIAALCRRAGKTKGSFYAHFPAIEAYARDSICNDLANYAVTENGSTRTTKSPSTQRII